MDHTPEPPSPTIEEDEDFYDASLCVGSKRKLDGIADHPKETRFRNQSKNIAEKISIGESEMVVLRLVHPVLRSKYPSLSTAFNQIPCTPPN